MQPEELEEAWPGDQGRVSLGELASLSGLTDEALRDLVACGVLQPSGAREVQWTFSAHWVVVARKACRLRDDFELDANALALTLRFLDRIRELESQLQGMQAQLPRVHPQARG